jgi:hypothetical protein
MVLKLNEIRNDLNRLRFNFLDVIILFIGVVAYFLIWCRYGFFLWTMWAAWISLFIPVLWTSIKSSLYYSPSVIFGKQSLLVDYLIGFFVGLIILFFLRAPNPSGGGMVFDVDSISGKTLEALEEFPGAFLSFLLLVLVTFILLCLLFTLIKKIKVFASGFREKK